MKRDREDREFHIITLRPWKLLVNGEKTKKPLIDVIEEPLTVTP